MMNAALSLSAKARSGTVTAADIKKAEEDRTKYQKTSAEGQPWWQFGIGAKGEAKNASQALTALTAAIERSTRALNEHASAAGGVTGVTANPARTEGISARNEVKP